MEDFKRGSRPVILPGPLRAFSTSTPVTEDVVQAVLGPLHRVQEEMLSGRAY